MQQAPVSPRNHDVPDLTQGSSRRYASWRQVAAYFDGDGSVSIRVRTFTLTFYLEFSESYLPQLLQIRNFLRSEGIDVPQVKIQRRSSNRITNYVLAIYSQRDVLFLCKKMLPFTFKKRWDLQTAKEYLQDRITVDEAIRKLNISIESGRREGLVRKTSIPFMKSEGISMASLIGGRRSSAKRAKLSEKQVETLRKLREKTGESYAELGRKFKVSSDVIRSVLGRK